MTTAWKAGGANGFVRTFAEDARFIAFDGTILAGREAIAGFHRQPFATYLKGSTLTLIPLSIQPLSDAIILVASQGGISKNGETSGDLTGESAQAFVISGTSSGPRICSFQNTRIRPLVETGAKKAWQDRDADL